VRYEASVRGRCLPPGFALLEWHSGGDSRPADPAVAVRCQCVAKKSSGFTMEPEERIASATSVCRTYPYEVPRTERPRPEMNRYCVWLRSTIFLVLWTVITLAGVAEAQTSQSSADLQEQLKLEREFTDPLTTLPQVLFRDSYTPANFGTNVQTNQLIVRPLIPRIPPRSLLPFAQLIRPTFSLVTVPSSRGGSRTEFGDLPVFDIAVLPWPDRQKTGLLIGVGPTFVFPTATSKSAGQGAWQAGPALGVIYTAIPGLVIGFVVQNPVSFAYTNPHRPPQNTFQFQPVFALHLWEKWYLRSAEANWSMGWHRHSPTLLPLSMGLGRTLVRKGLPPMSLFVTGQWMLYRQFARVAPQTTVNFGLVVALPQFQNIWGQ